MRNFALLFLILHSAIGRILIEILGTRRFLDMFQHLLEVYLFLLEAPQEVLRVIFDLSLGFVAKKLVNSRPILPELFYATQKLAVLIIRPVRV